MNSTATPRLSVIIPAFNEEPRLGATLDALAVYFAAAPYQVEVLVVDDGSHDRTADVAREHAAPVLHLRVLSYGGNRGKGFAVRFGMQQAKGDVAVFYDADGSTPITQIEKCWPHFDTGAAICLGSRALSESKIVVHQPWHRVLMGRTFNLLVRLLAVRGFQDTQCGFKAFTRDAAQIVFSRQQLTGFGFDVELLYIARQHRLRAVEVPVEWIDSPSSRVNAWRDSTRMFAEVMKIRWLALKGVYQ